MTLGRKLHDERVVRKSWIIINANSFKKKLTKLKKNALLNYNWSRVIKIWLLLVLHYQILFLKNTKMPVNYQRGPFLMGTIIYILLRIVNFSERREFETDTIDSSLQQNCLHPPFINKCKSRWCFLIDYLYY